MRNEGVPGFPSIYETYHDKVLAYATKLIGRDEAEDAVQEAFVKINRSLKSLEDPARLSSWIYAIAINTVRDAARRRASRVDRPSARSGPAPERAEEDSSLSQRPDTASRSPEEIAIRNEMIACYLDYVARLPRSSYDVYVLKELEDLSNEEIARRLSLPVGTVKIRLHRARARLNEELRRNCRCYQNERGELMAEPRNR